MKTHLCWFFLSGFILTMFTGCKPKYVEPTWSSGSLDLQRFVILGDGHSAGFMDDALYYEGQQLSLANFLSMQFEQVGAVPLTTRYVNENSVGSNASGRSRLIVDFKEDCAGISSLSPVRKAAQGDLSIISVSTFTGSSNYRNFGIPGMGILNITGANYAQFNPFYARVASSETSNVLADAVSNDPTFFGLYLGVEDALKYARTGGVTDNLPSIQDFTNTYTEVVEQFKANGAKGFIMTIPDVTVLPYFRTIPYNGLNIQNEEDATLLNNIFSPLGMSFNVGPNSFTITDPEANEFQVRQILEGEHLLLSIPLDSVKCFKLGSLYPFRNEFVLSLEEKNYLKDRVDAYNVAIRNLAATHGLALVETNALYEKMFSGFQFNGVKFSTQFISGGCFSLDGIHLNGKGNAFLTNACLEAINEYYNTQIPLLNPLKFNGIRLP
jgi:hypothetical protein